MKKSLLIVVALLCMASLMAAMAYSSTTITNAASLTVTSSDESLVALIPNDGLGNKDKAADIKDGKLVIDMAQGLNGDFGIQPDSFYKWDNLFTVKNNSNETIEFNITKDGWGYDTKVNVYLGAYEGAVKKEFYNRSNSKNGMVTLQPGEESIVYLHLETESGAKLQTRDAKLMVNVTAK